MNWKEIRLTMNSTAYRHVTLFFVMVFIINHLGCSDGALVASEARPHRDYRIIEEEIPLYDPEAVVLIKDRTRRIAEFLVEVTGMNDPLLAGQYSIVSASIATARDAYRAVIPADVPGTAEDFLAAVGPLEVRATVCNIGSARHCLQMLKPFVSVDRLKSLHAVMKGYKVEAMINMATTRDTKIGIDLGTP